MTQHSLKKTEKKEALLENLGKEFLQHKVSAAGVSYVVSAPSRLRRKVWLLGVTACVVFMGYMTANVVCEYLGYPKMLIKEDIIMPQLTFPAVTLCSLNPISGRYAAETSLKKFLKLKRILRDQATAVSADEGEREGCHRNPLCKWSWFRERCLCASDPCRTELCIAHNSTHCACSAVYCRGDHRLGSCENQTSESGREACICEALLDAEEFEDDYGDSDAAEDEKEDELLERMDDDVVELVRLIRNSRSHDLVDIEEALMPSTEELYEYGITFDSLVAVCTFQGHRCQRENFTVLYHPSYGKCYTFNYVGGGAKGSQKPIEIHNYGSNSGLRLLLRVNDDDILDLLRPEVGARIIIHDPYSLPFVEEYGMNVKPRDMTNIEMSMSKTKRLGRPWSVCVNASKDVNNIPYSVLGCEKNCGFHYLANRCNCTMRHFLRGSVLSRNTSTYPLCNIKDENQERCVSDVMEQFHQRNIKCNCDPPCRETTYSFTVTSSELNENYYWTSKAVRTLFLENGAIKYLNSTYQRKSMAGVKIYYNTLQIVNFREVASYSWETLVANIGGNLGFFMGLTLVTFMEVAEFLWDVFCTTFCPSITNGMQYYRNSRERKVSNKQDNYKTDRRSSI